MADAMEGASNRPSLTQVPTTGVYATGEHATGEVARTLDVPRIAWTGCYSR